MLRVLLSLALIALASTSAFAKPKVAILGLEVTGAVDAAGTTVARDLTEGMRARAKAGNGPYTLAPNSDRELIDEKVIKQCETEEPACMSEIGKDIEADVLVYGKLEKDGGGFQATIVTLDVKKRTTIKTTFVTVPPGAGCDQVRTIAKKTYLEIAPASGSAKLVVKANVDTGNVYVDDELRDTLTDGRATLTLPEGRYRIAVESDGYKRKELTIKLTEDDSATESFELSKSGGGGGGGGGINPWKPIFGVTALAAIGLGLYSTVKWNGSRNPNLLDEERAAIEAATGGDKDINNDDCTDTVFNAIDAATIPGDKRFEDSCSSYAAHVKFGFIAGGIGVVALVAGYFAFIHGGDSTTEPRSSVAITPTLTPNGGGATLRFEW